MQELIKKINSLLIWPGPIDCQPLSGGITNQNYLVTAPNGKFVVRLGDDIDEHQIKRFNELAASRAAHEAGLSPGVVHSEPGVLVLEYIASRTLEEHDIRDPEMLARIVPLVKKCHQEIPEFLRGPVLVFWVFHVVRDYCWTLKKGESNHLSKLNGLQEKSKKLENAAGPHDIVFGHNDLLCGNFLDDGNRLWLIDWDYAGFNSPLFDLGGLASNNGLSEAQEKWLLETYFDTPLTDQLWLRYQAMKCGSLLRETLWSMVSELHSKLDFDYAAYSVQNLEKFEQTFQNFEQMNS